jgi:hypothetical protein
MRCATVIVTATAAWLGLFPPTAHAQKGAGEPIGIARRAVKPDVVSLTGKLVEIRTGACEATTGGSPYGTHLVMDVPGKGQLNVHLGPARLVADTVAKLAVGQDVTVRAFRTDALKPNQYIAQTLSFGSTRVELRDTSLRPVWATGGSGPREETDLSPPAGAGRGPGGGRGFGYGRGRGPGPGAGCCGGCWGWSAPK